MRTRGALFLTLGLLLPLVSSGDGRAENASPSEYQIKSAFLFNFAKFVEWPSSAFPQANAPLVIGILGEDPFQDDLRKTIRDKMVDDHPLIIKALRSQAEATNCHILFISTSEKARLRQILDGLKGASVLTVGEMDRFTEAGGMINFVKAGTKIRFQINNEAALVGKLKISSKLLNYALR